MHVAHEMNPKTLNKLLADPYIEAKTRLQGADAKGRIGLYSQVLKTIMQDASVRQATDPDLVAMIEAAPLKAKLDRIIVNKVLAAMACT